jgi:GxxExxY protein
MENAIRKPDLLHPKLSYNIVGVLINVFKELGPDLLEKHYQRAIALEFVKAGIIFKEQVPVPLYYKGEKIGTYFADFLIEGLIILEIKKNKNFSLKHIEQLHGYLKAFDLQLGILANFTDNGVIYKRIVNIK